MRQSNYSESGSDDSNDTKTTQELINEIRLLRQAQKHMQEFADQQDEEIQELNLKLSQKQEEINDIRRAEDFNSHVINNIQDRQDQVNDIIQAKDNEIFKLLEKVEKRDKDLFLLRKRHEKEILLLKQQHTEEIFNLRNEIGTGKSKKDDDDEVVILSKPKMKKQPEDEFEGYDKDDLIKMEEIVVSILNDKTYDKFASLLKLLQDVFDETKSKIVHKWIQIMKRPNTIRKQQEVSLAHLITGFSEKMLKKYGLTDPHFLFTFFRFETPVDIRNFNDKIGQKLRHYLSLTESGLKQKLTIIKGLLNRSGTDQNQSKQKSVVKQNKNQTLLYEEEEEREQSNPGRRERGEGNNNNNNNNNNPDDSEQPKVEIQRYDLNYNEDFKEECNREITKIRRLKTNINHINCQMCGDTAAFSCAVYYCGKDCRDSQLTK